MHGLLLVKVEITTMLLHGNNLGIDFKKNNNIHKEVEGTKSSIVMIVINVRLEALT